MVSFAIIVLTHRGHVTHVSVNQTIFGSDNGSVPSHYLNQCLLIGPLITNFSEIVIKIHHFSLKKIHMKMSSAKWRPYCHGLTWCMSHTELLWLCFLPHIKWQVWRRLTRSPTWYWWHVCILTHWGRNEMVAILFTTFSTAFFLEEIRYYN